MIEARIAHYDERTEERGEEHEEGRETLFDVLASFPLEERVEMIERMAERMGV